MLFKKVLPRPNLTRSVNSPTHPDVHQRRSRTLHTLRGNTSTPVETLPTMMRSIPDSEWFPYPRSLATGSK